MNTALIGISLDNASYSSSQMREALLSGSLNQFDKIYFLVADTLQIYNQISRITNDPDRLASQNWSLPKNQYLKERRLWLSKLQQRLPNWPEKQTWSVVGVNEVTDRRTFQIYRSVRILYTLDSKFREDVLHYAERYADKLPDSAFYEERKNLSAEYILEEIAINIRLRVGHCIAQEFYLGKTFPLFLNIYGGKYLKNHLSLFGSNLQNKQRKTSYSFNSWSDRKKIWVLEKGPSYTNNQTADIIHLKDR